jgi:hypothetical protein
MFPTDLFMSGRSTNNSTNRSSSKMATRVSRLVAEIKISRFN